MCYRYCYVSVSLRGRGNFRSFHLISNGRPSPSSRRLTSLPTSCLGQVSGSLVLCASWIPSDISCFPLDTSDFFRWFKKYSPKQTLEYIGIVTEFEGYNLSTVEHLPLSVKCGYFVQKWVFFHSAEGTHFAEFIVCAGIFWVLIFPFNSRMRFLHLRAILLPTLSSNTGF